MNSSTFDTFLLCIINFSSSTPCLWMLFFPLKKAFQLTVSVNRQLIVHTTSRPGCAINRKDKKVKQEELCWSQFWPERSTAQICLLFTGMLQQILRGKGRKSVLCVCTSASHHYFGTCGLASDSRFIVSMLELQPVKGDSFSSLILLCTNNVLENVWMICCGLRSCSGQCELECSCHRRAFLLLHSAVLAARGQTVRSNT